MTIYTYNTLHHTEVRRGQGRGRWAHTAAATDSVLGVQQALASLQARLPLGHYMSGGEYCKKDFTACIKSRIGVGEYAVR